MTRGPEDMGPSRELTAEESERLSRYLAGELSPEERSRIEREILGDPGLAEALYADLSLKESIAAVDDVTRARARSESARPRFGARWLRVALPAAAIVVLAVLVPRFFEDEGGTRRLRSPAPAERAPAKPAPAPSPAPSVVALFPTGSFDEPPSRFVWTRDSTATSYRIEILDESAAIVFSAETPETSLAFPSAALGGSAGKILSWRVVPLQGTAPRAPSKPLRFQFGA